MTGALRQLIAGSALVAAAAFGAADASAQSMADMSGIPLPDASLPDGTVTVRVIGGSFSEPVVGVDVAVSAGEGAERVARTDAEGRATLPGLTAGAQYIASATIGGTAIRSKPFTVPPKGGVRLLLSAGGGAGPMRPGAARPGGQMHSPFEVSGRPQANQALGVGVLSVQLLRGDWTSGVEGGLVHLIGYHADGQVTRVAKVTGKDGRAQFSGLAPVRVSYFAVALLDGEGGTDRLQSLPIVLSPQAGVGVVLAGSAAGTDKPAEPIDDIDRLYIDQEAPPIGPGPGEVVVRLRGQQAEIEAVKDLEILEVGKPDVAAKSPSRPAAGGPGAVRGNAFAPMKSKHPAGTLAVMVVRATENTPPVPGVTVEVRPEDSETATSATTDAEGMATFEGLDPTKKYRAAAVLKGQRIEAPLVELPTESGVLVPIGVDWGKAQRYEGRFTSIPAAADKVYMARAELGGRVYHSPPFQLTATKGATVAIPLFPNQDVRFRVSGSLDDRYMQFQGMFSVSHGSFVPFDPGPDGFAIPLPKSFAAASVQEELARVVKVVPGRGLVWTSVIPPGGAEVGAAFTVPVDEGAFELQFDLPNGAIDSEIRIEHSPGMEVRVSGDLGGDLETRADGREFFVISDINLSPDDRLQVEVSGLPHQPAWRRQARIAAGLVALLLAVWALSVVLLRSQRSTDVEGPVDLRERLLEELVTLEQRKRAGEIAGPRYQRMRDQLMRQLEPLYAEDASGETGRPSPRTA